VKPDGIKRGLTGEILKRFERKGLNIVAVRMVTPTLEMAEDHYLEHEGNHNYYHQMCEALAAGPLLAVVLEGPSSIQAARQLIGYSCPVSQSQIGTIRGDLAIQQLENLVHGSDSKHAAAREIAIWFSDDPILYPKPKKKKVVEVKAETVEEAEVDEEVADALKVKEDLFLKTMMDMKIAPSFIIESYKNGESLSGKEIDEMPFTKFIGGPPKKSNFDWGETPFKLTTTESNATL
jgi:nucleoside-diphosphate kinase